LNVHALYFGLLLLARLIPFSLSLLPRIVDLFEEEGWENMRELRREEIEADADKVVMIRKISNKHKSKRSQQRSRTLYSTESIQGVTVLQSIVVHSMRELLIYWWEKRMHASRAD
jgi:hypothetical protein